MLVYLYKIYKGARMKSVVICIGVIIIGIYISPLYKSKINIGNIFGIILGLLLIGSSIYFEQIKALYSLPSGKIFIIIICILFAVFTIVFAITMAKIILSAKQKPKPSDTIIVLGCRVKGRTPSKALIKRCSAAAEYMKANPKATVILSGGQGADEDISEAQCMKSLMLSFGISEQRLILENKSTSTEENLLFSKKIIDKKGYSKNVVIATSEYHIYRAKLFAKKLGLNVSGVPAKSIPVLRVAYFTREVFGIWWLKLKETLS